MATWRQTGIDRSGEGPGRSFSTGRLHCHPLVESDIDDLVALDADPEVMRYINGGRPTARAESEQRVATSSEWTWSARLAGGPFAGWLSLRPTGSGERELGYRLQRQHWGRGLATEGAAALVDLAFGWVGTERVWAQTMTVNTASRRVMEKAGLVFVRQFFGDWEAPIPGSGQGDVEYELTRERWSTLR